MEFKWWEKTVEYNFIMLLASKSNLFLSPMDGNHEKLGDTALGIKSDFWVMIEFKRDYESIKSEEGKFDDYSQAKAALNDIDGHHHIVYGALTMDDKNNPYLSLKTQTYFSKQPNHLDGLLSSGKAFKEFSDYLNEFIKFKTKKASNGSGGTVVEDYMMVAGVTTDGQIVECISMSEFRKEHNLELEVVKTKKPSLGR